MGPEPFEYRMAYTPLGLVFTDYTHASTIPNPEIEGLILRAVQTVHDKLRSNPDLRGQPLMESFTMLDRAYGVFLHIVPNQPDLTWGELEQLLPVLRAWTREYESVECDFSIWASPGTSQAKRLGTGHIVLSA